MFQHFPCKHYSAHENYFGALINCSAFAFSQFFFYLNEGKVFREIGTDSQEFKGFEVEIFIFNFYLFIYV